MITVKEEVQIKTPPEARPLEEAILGGCMLDNTILPVLAQVLESKHFYDPEGTRQNA